MELASQTLTKMTDDDFEMFNFLINTLLVISQYITMHNINVIYD